MTDNFRKTKLLWLGTNIFMVVSMIIIGGITRLTDSGLSMTEWNLIKGALPPLNNDMWIKLFDEYKKFPEYNLKNSSMTLIEFKKIFFWEYLHRMWGRLIGLVFFIPLTFFWMKGYFSKNEKKLLTAMTLIGFFQAFMGWYMVESGLIDKPDVSHFRLSVHLITAFIIYTLLLYFFWNLFTDVKYDKLYNNRQKIIKSQKTNFLISIFLLYSTIIAGALVSGTEAGLAYNNFPYMGEGFLPPIISSWKSINLNELLYDQGFLQFIHRILATSTLLFIFYTLIKAKKFNIFLGYEKLYYSLFAMIILQYSLGIIVLKLYVPIFLGLMHQLGSLIMLTLLVISFCQIKKMGLRSPILSKNI